jgi:hypothetical protein
MIVPARIATNVPISTMPLPPVSSASDRCCGRYAYFTGPNSVECNPIRNTPANNRNTRFQTNPAAIASMIAISRFLTKRISAPFSKRSASWPAVAEKSTNGRMKMPPITAPADFGSSPPHCAAL